MKKYPKKSKQTMEYHGRNCRPIIRWDKKKKTTYVTVRKEEGGTRRLYHYQQYME